MGSVTRKVTIANVIILHHSSPLICEPTFISRFLCAKLEDSEPCPQLTVTNQ